jgi:hypothetical protein
MKFCLVVTTIKYRKQEDKTTAFIALTLLTETRLNVEDYGRHSKALLPLMVVDCKCKADTENTGSNS